MLTSCEIFVRRIKETAVISDPRGTGLTFRPTSLYLLLSADMAGKEFYLIFYVEDPGSIKTELKTTNVRYKLFVMLFCESEDNHRAR